MLPRREPEQIAQVVFAVGKGIVGLPGQLQGNGRPPPIQAQLQLDMSVLAETVQPAQQSFFQAEPDAQHVGTLRAQYGEEVFHLRGDLIHRLSGQRIFCI